MKKTFLSLLAVMLMFVFASSAFAVDARDGIPAPPGTVVLVNYYQYISGHKYYWDGKKASKLPGASGALGDVGDNYDINSTLWTFRPTYYGKVGAFPWVITAFFTWGDKEGTATTGTGFLPASSGGLTPFTGENQVGLHAKTQGMADLRVAAGIWPYSNYATKTHVVTLLYVTAPTGEYQNQRVLGNAPFNMGTNWWSFQPEFGIIKGFGPFYVQLLGGAFFYTDNDDFGANSGTFKKEPNYYGELHLSYDITPKFWVASSFFYMYGGRTKSVTPAGATTDNHDLAQDWTLELAAQYRVLPEMAVLLATKPKLHTENGSDAAANIFIKISYFF